MCEVYRTIFLTVGTTEFVELIAAIDNITFVDVLITMGCQKLIVQIGRGIFPTILARLCEQKNIHYHCYRFKPDLLEDMQASDLIISHCGAGSILEAMNLRKPLIVVVNSTLQGNHQTELSDALAVEGHCLSTSPTLLRTILSQLVRGELDHESFTKPFPDAQLDIFPAAIDSLFGFPQL